MKVFATISFFLLSILSYSQNCSNPTPSVIFQQKFNLIAQQKGDMSKLRVANDFMRNACITSSQVKSIAALFAEDSYRLKFCMEASKHTLDMVNFYDVYDAFSTFSTAFRLHDYVHDKQFKGGQPLPDKPGPPIKPTIPTFPAISYPNYTTYKGKKGCEGPVTDEQKFDKIAQNVFEQPTDESKMVAISNAFEGGACFSFAQAMKLASLIEQEPLRLKALKEEYASVYDMANYNLGIYLFKTNTLQKEWANYASNAYNLVVKPGPAQPVEPKCYVTDDDFTDIISTLRGVYFSRDKMELMERWVKDRCFSVEQIKTMMKEFPSGKDAVEVAKMCWWRCNEQKNYYKVVDALTFSTDKQELNQFIDKNSK
ncbi:MAG: DUF4476 domain-containing protein [Cyclobacteriaceae bacterium]|nr:DUF4476 domain-containing protein [Cyclobacteriaceae bacterium]